MNPEHNLFLEQIRDDLADIGSLIHEKMTEKYTLIDDAEKMQLSVLDKHIFNLIVVCETMQKQQ